MAKNFTAAENRCEGHIHVLLITTGSVASIKAPLIVRELLKVSETKHQAQFRIYTYSDPLAVSI